MKQCIVAFTEATNTFFQQDYQLAKNLLTNYNQLDSTYMDYESYAFLAECYNQLGMPDSGKIVYQNIIEKLTKSLKAKAVSSDNRKFAIEDLKNWFSNFPEFPKVLKKENGFVPYDKLPDPIGGVSEIQKQVVYPYDAVKKSGKVLVFTLINEKGKAIDFDVYKSLSEPYDNAAIHEIKNINFTEPKRKGRTCKIWVSIPIVFN